MPLPFFGFQPYSPASMYFLFGIAQKESTKEKGGSLGIRGVNITKLLCVVILITAVILIRVCVGAAAADTVDKAVDFVNHFVPPIE